MGAAKTHFICGKQRDKWYEMSLWGGRKIEPVIFCKKTDVLNVDVCCVLLAQEEFYDERWILYNDYV